MSFLNENENQATCNIVQSVMKTEILLILIISVLPDSETATVPDMNPQVL